MAIPTRYAGVQFRSRLEARWAAFFDLASWRWEYEPSDEEGWIPDFFLFPVDADSQPIAVEVKPIEWTRDHDANCKIYEERSDLEKVRRHKRLERLVLGKYIPDAYGGRVIYAGDSGGPYDCDCFFGVTVSSGWSDGKGEGELDWAEPAILYRGSRPRVLDYAAAYGSYHYRIGCEWDGRSHLQDAKRGLVESLWREAGNRVQWRPPV